MKMSNELNRAIKLFLLTMAVVVTVFLCSCAPKMGCTNPQTDYWQARGMPKN
jgi:hypothetical protein